MADFLMSDLIASVTAKLFRLVIIKKQICDILRKFVNR
ncbi:MAG: hypothetical protein JWP81_1482 [Ferruginibacter sp.]|nr:hypothetical protein [Ferruginibacter sp.]